MIVVDASVLVSAFTEEGAASWQLLDDEWSSVPHLHAEVFSGVRGLHMARRLSRQRAERAVEWLAEASVFLVDTPLLLHRMWELRDNVTGYDAAYVAAAEVLDCPLVTSDGRLAAAPGIRCEVRLAA